MVLARVEAGMDGEGDRVEPLPLRRRATVDYMRVAGGRSDVFGLVEADVTDSRRRLREHREDSGEDLSFTAFLSTCLAATVREFPSTNAYRDWRGRVHTFADVDVNVLVETDTEAGAVGVPTVIRAVDDRSVRSVHDAIRRAQDAEAPQELSWVVRLALRLPGVLRRAVWRLPQWLPRRWTALAGTVAVTSVGMFGERGGWAISPTGYTLQVAVGGIAEKPGYVDGDLEPRELLALTLTVDHDLVDGAEAARFADRFVSRLEDGYGLDDPGDVPG
jgi:pyruvate/2-oxoglutarate dehydrogenase complex dihydrolipoamide acyltransferase (E2) component